MFSAILETNFITMCFNPSYINVSNTKISTANSVQINVNCDLGISILHNENVANALDDYRHKVKSTTIIISDYNNTSSVN
jgi:hypothetical protein